MSMTITATEGGSTANGIILTVKVITGYLAAGPIGTPASSLTANAKALTPAASGSWVYAAGADNITGATGNGSTTVSGTEVDTPDTWAGWTGRSTSTTTGGTPVTVGITQTPSSFPALALLEIKAGSGLGEDISAPAVAKTLLAAAVTSAAFTPPGAALLVVMAGCEVGFSGATTITISNTGGLTFTQQVAAGGTGSNYLAGIWTAVLGTAVTLTPGARVRAAQPITPQALSGTVTLVPARRTRAAQPIAVSAGTHTTALAPAARARVAQPVTPQVISPFPRDPLAIMVELLIGATWTDVTPWVYLSRTDVIAITSGRPDESGFVSPSSLALTVNNNDGRFSPKNAMSPWWGLIGKNTQIRVSVQAANPDDGSRQYRYWGEVAEWPFTWSPNDVDRKGLLKGAGVLRRLQQSGSLGTSPAPLALPYTAYLAGLAGTSQAPVAWWPCTDPAGSTQFASGIAGGPPMTFIPAVGSTAPPGFAATAVLPGSAPLPTFSQTCWIGLLQGATLSQPGTVTVTDRFTFSQPWTCPPETTVLQEVVVVGDSGGSSSGVGGGTDIGGAGAGAGGVCVRTNVASTPAKVYNIVVGQGGAGPPPSGGGGDGTGSTFPADSGDITSGGGTGSSSGSSPGNGGSGDFPGGDGAPSSGFNEGGGGGGAGGLPGASPPTRTPAGGQGEHGAANGGNGGALGQPGQGGQVPGGAPGGGGASSTATGQAGTRGEVDVTYQTLSGGSITVPGGPQNANVLRFPLLIPDAGDVNGSPVMDMPTSGTIAQLIVVYYPGAAILSAPLGTGAITAIAVDPTPYDIPSGRVITVFGSNGTQQFTTSSDTPAGSISIAITSSTAAITTAAGTFVTLGSDQPGYLVLRGYNASNTLVLESGLCNFGVNGVPVLVSAELAQSGTAVNWTLQVLAVGAAVPVAFTGTLASSTVGSAGGVLANPDNQLDGTACGQITIAYATSPISALALPIDGYDGETAAARFLRLCAQQGIASQVTGDPAASVPMGVQASDSFVNLVQDCEVADRGLVYEPRTFLGLAYRTRTSMLSQTPAANLPYTSFTLPDDPPLQPDYDDQYTSNDITVTRTGGSSLEVTLTTGRLSTAPPPAGVGPYASSLQVNVATDAQLPDMAGWLLHVSTTDEYRFPTIAVRAEYESIANTALWQAVGSVNVGDFVQVSEPPSWLVSDDIRQLVFGVTETISPWQWVLAWNSVPESPYEVAVSDVAMWRADTTGSTLHAGITSTATALQVDTTAAGTPLWDTTGADDPFDIVIGGERMTVTAISGTSSPQAFTVVRSVNGVVKAHLALEPVDLFNIPVASI